MLTLISNSAHYVRVLAHCSDVKHTLWIGTADIKDAYIEMKGEKVPFLKLLAQLTRIFTHIQTFRECVPAFGTHLL